MLTEHEQATRLRRTFEDRVAKSAFKKIDDELRVVGKFAEISVLHTGELDIWIKTPITSDLIQMGARKLNIVCSAVSRELPEVQINELDGEAWFQTEHLPDSLFKVLGIRKKAVYSEEHKKALTERLRVMREAKS